MGSELPITIESFTFKDPDSMRALDFETNEITIEWTYNNQVNEGDYFDIILDEQMKLAPGTILDLQESLVNNGVEYVDVSVVAVGSVHSIRYTFNNKADGLIVNGEVISFNNIARPMPDVTPIEDTDGHGHFKAGYKQTLTYMIGGTPITQEITYIEYPTVTESIYYLNSWFNSKVLDRNVFWDPTIEGKLIQGYLEIHNAKQFQPGNIGDYGETSNLVLSQMIENEYATINKDADIRISLERFDGVENYEAFETHYVRYDEIEYVDDETFTTYTIDFEELGFVDKKD